MTSHFVRRALLLGSLSALLFACDGTAPAPAVSLDGAISDADVPSDSGVPSDEFAARVQLAAGAPGPILEGKLFGSNVLATAPGASTIQDADFVAATADMGVKFLRWPGGNLSDLYDWKTDEHVRPGTREQRTDGIGLRELLEFASRVGATPVVTVNFGSMTPADAADLVEFLNGPADSPWGARRAAMGYAEPIGVEFFEVGNEENQPHMWFYSWTAEDPMKYFFGGSEERRGAYDNSGGPAADILGMKGDVFRVSRTRHPAQEYSLRFAPVRAVRVFWALTGEDANIDTGVEWTQVDDLSTQGPGAQVFEVNGASGALRFGDGTHGVRPTDGSYFNVEYTTFGHAGFVDFARAMHAALSSVPIRVGSAVLPASRAGTPITDTVGMRAILDQADFFVQHQYNADMPGSEWDDLHSLRQVPLDRVEQLRELSDGVTTYAESIGVTRAIGVGVTEWNIFLATRSWELNRSQAGAVIGGEFLVRVMAARPDLPVLVANHFALHGGALALLRSQRDGSMAPLGHVFAGFSDWVGSRWIGATVDSPSAMAYSRDVPFVSGTAAISADGSTLRVALVNNNPDQAARVVLEPLGFEPTDMRVRRVAGRDCTANNDTGGEAIALVDLGTRAYEDNVSVPRCGVVFVELSR